jgi:hypothetical protein
VCICTRVPSLVVVGYGSNRDAAQRRPLAHQQRRRQSTCSHTSSTPTFEPRINPIHSLHSIPQASQAGLGRQRQPAAATPRRAHPDSSRPTNRPVPHHHRRSHDIPTTRQITKASRRPPPDPLTCTMARQPQQQRQQQQRRRRGLPSLLPLLLPLLLWLAQAPTAAEARKRQPQQPPAPYKAHFSDFYQVRIECIG